MNTLEMISRPLLFVEDLREHAKKVHQAVELIALLTDALLASDHERVRHLREQVSEIRGQADRIKQSLYGQFKHLHFRGVGGYAVGQYIAGQDKVVESAETFAEVLVSRKTTVPTELHADLQALVDQVVQVSGQMLSLTGILWPPEETMSTDPEASDVLDAIERIVEGHRRARQLGMEFSRHLYGLEGQLDPTCLLCLDKWHTALREVASNTAHAADLLRMVV